MKQLELPIFSDQPAEYLKVNDFECFHNFEQEITRQILDRDKAKNPEIECPFETKHKYIDF